MHYPDNLGSHPDLFPGRAQLRAEAGEAMAARYQRSADALESDAREIEALLTRGILVVENTELGPWDIDHIEDQAALAREALALIRAWQSAPARRAA